MYLEHMEVNIRYCVLHRMCQIFWFASEDLGQYILANKIMRRQYIDTKKRTTQESLQLPSSMIVAFCFYLVHFGKKCNALKKLLMMGTVKSWVHTNKWWQAPSSQPPSSPCCVCKAAALAFVVWKRVRSCTQ